MKAEKKATNATILITGEWPLVYEGSMTDHIWRKLESKGYHLKRMPLSEYLWFLWNDREQGVTKGRTETNPEIIKQLECYKSQMEMFHHYLNTASSFSENLEALTEIASQTLGKFTSSNGRYRYGKKVQMENSVDGIINVASMYENTDMILKDYDNNISAPILNLTLDGVQDEGIEQKLESFLYYL